MINVKVSDAIAADLGSKWCSPGRNGGGVSVDNYNDYCPNTAALSITLIIVLFNSLSEIVTVNWQ